MKSKRFFGNHTVVLMFFQAMPLMSPLPALAQSTSPSAPTLPSVAPAVTGTAKSPLEIWVPILAAIIAVAGVMYQIRSNKIKDLDEFRRQREALQACLVSDIKAVLRVIDVARVIDHMLARYFEPNQEFPMAGGPRAEDYFVLYTAVAKNLGDLDKEVGIRATAFYVLLKGSRDVAQSFDHLKIGQSPDDKVTSASSLTARIVLEMLEHMHRHGFIAIALANQYGVQRSIALAELDTSEKFAGQIFRTWLFLIALRQHLSTDDKPSRVSLIAALKQPQHTTSALMKASLAEVKINFTFPDSDLPGAMEDWIRRVQL